MAIIKGDSSSAIVSLTESLQVFNGNVYGFFTAESVIT